MGKVFVGHWVDQKTRNEFKASCALHGVNQGDLMELLLKRWLKKPNIINPVKELQNEQERGEE